MPYALSVAEAHDKTQWRHCCEGCYLSMAPFRLEILWRACDRSPDSCITEHQTVILVKGFVCKKKETPEQQRMRTQARLRA